LRGISATYDPLGFITPLTIPARMPIQEIWKLKLDWDDSIQLELIERLKGIAAWTRETYLMSGHLLASRIIIL
jgi:uncharacterized protein CbrC (UPF0167 family)